MLTRGIRRSASEATDIVDSRWDVRIPRIPRVSDPAHADGLGGGLRAAEAPPMLAVEQFVERLELGRRRGPPSVPGLVQGHLGQTYLGMAAFDRPDGRGRRQADLLERAYRGETALAFGAADADRAFGFAGRLLLLQLLRRRRGERGGVLLLGRLAAAGIPGGGVGRPSRAR